LTLPDWSFWDRDRERDGRARGQCRCSSHAASPFRLRPCGARTPIGAGAGEPRLRRCKWGIRRSDGIRCGLQERVGPRSPRRGYRPLVTPRAPANRTCAGGRLGSWVQTWDHDRQRHVRQVARFRTQ
jgi:hypothetical protein